MIERNFNYLQAILALLVEIDDTREKLHNALTDKAFTATQYQKDIAALEIKLNAFEWYEVEATRTVLTPLIDYAKLNAILKKGAEVYKGKRKMLNKTGRFDDSQSNWFNAFLDVLFELVLLNQSSFDSGGSDTGMVLVLLYEDVSIKENKNETTTDRQIRHSNSNI